jgi:hypothetical protein
MRKIMQFVPVLLLLLFGASSSYAVPSFARQTGLSCNVCHYTPPELTPFGRIFKLSGYSLITDAKKNTIGNGKTLELLKALPLSVAFTVSDTELQAKEPGTQNGTAAFPQDLSLYLAGELAPHVGTFFEVAYTHMNDHFGMGMSDLRYANHTKLAGKTFQYGINLNNQPTLEDLWNSTPAEGYPWIASATAVSPIAAPLIAGALSQDVVGLGGYGMWNNHLYGDVTVYRSEHAGGATPITGTNFNYNISGVAPYWRAAWQQNFGANYLEVGTYGIYVRSFPGAVSGPENVYTDPSFDFSFTRPFGPNTLSVHGTYMRENSDLQATYLAGGAAFANHNLNLGRADATYYWRSKYTATASYFTTVGTADTTLYAPAAVTGSNNGSPNTTGYIVQGSYWPVQNIDITLAYTGYTKFNGASTNYDGANRNASDNNTVYLAMWLNF